MKIGFDFRMGGGAFAGIGRYAFALLEHILQLETDHDFVVFHRPQQVGSLELERLGQFDNVRLVEINAPHYSVSEQTIFLKMLNVEKCDLVHFPNFNVPVRYNLPFVVTIHDMAHHAISGKNWRRWIYFQLYKYVIEQAARKAQRIVTVSEASKAEIVELLEVPSDKVEVVYEGVAIQEQSEEVVKRVKREFLLRRPYFLFVGTLERRKNVATLTRAFGLFLEKYKLDMDLVITGKVDAFYPEVKYDAMNIKHSDHLVFTDFVFDDELAGLYQGAHAFVTASRYEGFCLPAVEAMQFGLPVLATNLPVFNEICDNGALYFDADNLDDVAHKMKLVANDPMFYKQCSLKSRTRGSFFSWERAAEETLTVYEGVLRG